MYLLTHLLTYDVILWAAQGSPTHCSQAPIIWDQILVCLRNKIQIPRLQVPVPVE